MASRRSDVKKTAKRMARIEANQKLIMEALGIGVSEDTTQDEEPDVSDEVQVPDDVEQVDTPDTSKETDTAPVKESDVSDKPTSKKRNTKK